LPTEKHLIPSAKPENRQEPQVYRSSRAVASDLFQREESQDEPDNGGSQEPRMQSRRPNAENRKPTTERYSNKPQDIIRSSLERGLTPGKIMSIVGIVDEVLATMGPDGVDIILEQYKNMGLKAEEERLIYGVLKMLNESKMQTDDIIAMLYRFGQVLGLNDDEAELQYTRLMANRKNRKLPPQSRNKIREAIS
jgi:hypothetical protein